MKIMYRVLNPLHSQSLAVRSPAIMRICKVQVVRISGSKAVLNDLGAQEHRVPLSDLYETQEEAIHAASAMRYSIIALLEQRLTELRGEFVIVDRSQWDARLDNPESRKDVPMIDA